MPSIQGAHGSMGCVPQFLDQCSSMHQHKHLVVASHTSNVLGDVQHCGHELHSQEVPVGPFSIQELVSTKCASNVNTFFDFEATCASFLSASTLFSLSFPFFFYSIVMLTIGFWFEAEMTRLISDA